MRNTWSIKRNTSGVKVFVGLSGGVDSAVSAALLKERGYDVTGVFIRIALEGYPCTAEEDKLDAMRVAAHLQIPFLAIDLSEEYRQRVFGMSIREFEKGRTPNPDALCNREIKFGLFFDWCMAQGADFVATGHYAQLKNEQGRTLLMAGKDNNKDQSYFLWAVSETKLRQTMFPVGHLQKPEVRALAQKFGLPNAGRKDSQGLCFLGSISLDEMLHRELPLVRGAVLDETGAVIGTHEGAAAYTLGQRHGFVLAAQAPDTPPHYVIDKDIEFNTITVSPNKFPASAAETKVKLAETNWVGPVHTGPCMARYRYRQALIHATCDGGVTLHAPHYVPEGQSLVLYLGKRCLGGGIINSATLS